MLANAYILAVLNSIVFVALFFMFMNKEGYVYRYKFNTKFILISIVLILMIKKGLIFGTISLQDILRMFLIVYLICKVFYRIDLRKSIIRSILYSLVYILIECSIFWFLYFSPNGVDYIFEIVLISNFIIFFVGISFLNIIKSIYKNKKYYLHIILTTITNLLIIVFINKSNKDAINLYDMVVKGNVDFYYVLDMLIFSSKIKEVFPYLILIISVLLISIFLNSIKSEKEKAKREIVNEKLDMQYKYYLMVKESQEKMKQVYHDMNNHMENIRSLKNSSEDVNKYIDNIEDEVKNNKNIYNTGNALLDIILYEKSKDCIKNNIDFNVGIDFSKCEFIDMIDISSIFSNLIDNAIEACNKIDDNNIEKYITIKGTFIKNYYVVRCENSKTNKVIIKNNKILTSKKDKFLHGIGLYSIKSSIKKYNGELKIKNSEFKFITSIHIPFE
ncbi:MAG: sensor histidine kinase [Paraclostridium bifermentans]|uniref:sensor histidine kinase n=1 Tax=Paraclostridium bifermentans TaxID=1490 RepID=UPI001D1F2E25|nr:ATP-binding protein [Paraclostridium bifermentans]MBS6507928.1 sensor histidine kinase [Paraclostridium bifermentans]